MTTSIIHIALLKLSRRRVTALPPGERRRDVNCTAGRNY